MHIPTNTSQMRRKHFVYIIDSYWNLMTPDLPDQLRELGLEYDKDFKITPAQNAEAVMKKENGGYCMVDSENLLVFMSTFFGDVRPAIILSRKIKELKPKARIIFRSTLPAEGGDSVFDGCIKKTDDTTELLKIIENFLGE